MLGVSESLLEQFGISRHEAKQHKIISEAMTKADKTASHCTFKEVHNFQDALLIL